MGAPSIIQKLTDHLYKHMPPNEECHVLYLMVEIRKVLDQTNSNNYPALRFYANWCVHTSIDRPNNFMRDTSEAIRDEIRACIDARTVISRGRVLREFLSMEQLRNTLGQFLHDNRVPAQIIEDPNWSSFQKLLKRILSEQAVIRPCAGINRFVYNDDGHGVVEYEVTPPQYKSFVFG